MNLNIDCLFGIIQSLEFFLRPAKRFGDWSCSCSWNFFKFLF